MSVKAALTADPRTDPSRTQAPGKVENRDYIQFCARAIRAASRRVADGDIEALGVLAGLAEELDDAVTAAVNGLRTEGYSWAEIGHQLDISKQAAHERWG
jgi:hypothetical protein